MSLLRQIVGFFAVVSMTGCSTPADVPPPAPGNARSSAIVTMAAPAPQEPEQVAKPQTAPETVKLAAYEVRESAISDFGISVRTNFEVKWGGKIEWMRVSAISASSPAARAGLAAGDQILAIDGQLITDMGKTAMLDALFQRKKGDTCRMLVLGQKESLPRFVTLLAYRAGGA